MFNKEQNNQGTIMSEFITNNFIDIVEVSKVLTYILFSIIGAAMLWALATIEIKGA